VKAFVVRDFEKPGAVEEIADRVGGENEVLVRVHTASVNPFDAATVSGATRAWAETRVPFVPGVDGAGTVVALGPGARGFEVGDPVIVNAGTKGYWGEGTFAELVSVPADAVFKQPAELNDVDAATLSLAGLTAQAAIEAIEPQPGSVILVIGATGGIGSWFTQLATVRGAKVVALARAENAEYARGLGAAEVIDHTAGDVIQQTRAKFPEGVDAIADFSGNGELIESLSALVKPSGKITSSNAQIDSDAYAARGLVAARADRAPLDRTPELLALIASGRIKAPETTVVTLEQAGDAVINVGERHTRGKVVVRVSE
jgi:NADPH:quinone reductase-like Zn-dependent oxidoreductase